MAIDKHRTWQPWRNPNNHSFLVNLIVDSTLKERGQERPESSARSVLEKQVEGVGELVEAHHLNHEADVFGKTTDALREGGRERTVTRDQI
jgi:hypothetical protein